MRDSPRNEKKIREKLLSGPVPRGGPPRAKPAAPAAQAPASAEQQRNALAIQDCIQRVQSVSPSMPWESRAALSLKEVIEYGNVSMAALYNEINTGKLRAVKRGRRTLVLRTDFERWLHDLPVIKPKTASG